MFRFGRSRMVRIEFPSVVDPVLIAIRDLHRLDFQSLVEFGKAPTFTDEHWKALLERAATIERGHHQQYTSMLEMAVGRLLARGSNEQRAAAKLNEALKADLGISASFKEQVANIFEHGLKTIELNQTFCMRKPHFYVAPVRPPSQSGSFSATAEM